MSLTGPQRAAGLAAISRLTQSSAKSIKSDPGAWVEEIGAAVLAATPKLRVRCRPEPKQPTPCA